MMNTASIAREFGFSPAELATLALTAAHATFLPSTERAALVLDMEQEIAALRAELGV